MTLANAHALFYGLKADPSFLASLTVPEGERKALMDARQEIREELKAAASYIITQDEYWQPGSVQRSAIRNRPPIQIKFMTQGSFSYKTLNVPARRRVQEIDLDDGMYVPIDYLENGEPALVAKGLYDFVEKTLASLCKRRGWKLDTTKECCVRVKLWEGAHIDLPIYSIPRDRFVQLRESMARTATASMTYDSVKGDWKLPSDKIMLAQRDGKWVQSDPQQLHDWVEGRVERYGAVYRRLSRFFKGWRDFTWERSKLSSLCLMCAVDLALRQLDGLPTENRDDELVLEVAKRLPDILNGKIMNPVLGHLCINEWDNEVRGEILEGAEKLRIQMIAALERTGDAEQVVLKLRARFGHRIPYRPDVVTISSTISAIEKAPAQTVAAPRVIPTTSG
ncbi:conserved hypothetical protein [Methylorubrum populi BJ001]|uniref:Cyclic GMP-AMP synthase n=1 Tax=Methylorubrum populi (strain ATCC BAA-705 / NCIMB 13946 / BJ001) TaxID=441620 RepID=B1Z8T7_METPB|nr:hypothetical protein [Methylorubrum populi]ACB83239.1 conserved hypothetical protein [Methylorubrum populi BJ001]PZP68191.1 MAG: hypothetical protein DI590_17770 [Methylorubrum populi]